jgi:hypothetical protein
MATIGEMRLNVDSEVGITFGEAFQKLGPTRHFRTNRNAGPGNEIEAFSR